MGTTAELVPSLVRLRADMNAIAPDRDRTSDGWIGNRPHQLTVSDHNDDEVGRVPIHDADRDHEVHAIDVDDDLQTPGLTMEMVVQHTLSRCRAGLEKRLRYVIYNRRIWEASNGWRERRYTGDSPHTEHAHFSGSYDSIYEADASTWHLEDIPMALTDSDKKWFIEQIDVAATRAAERVWATEWNIERAPGKPAYMAHASDILANVPSEHGKHADQLKAIGAELKVIEAAPGK